jgi:hypothetical protein
VEGALIIGVVDYTRQKDEHFSSASVNAVAWNGWSHGQVEFGGGNLLETEEGFREGDVVSMKVELEKGLITWEVEGKSSTIFYSSILQEPDRELVPFAEFYDVGDTITILGSLFQYLSPISSQ